MSPEFAASLADVRLLQTARLLEWMLRNVETDVEAVSCALGAVLDARGAIKSLGFQEASGWPPPGSVGR